MLLARVLLVVIRLVYLMSVVDVANVQVVGVVGLMANEAVPQLQLLLLPLLPLVFLQVRAAGEDRHRRLPPTVSGLHLQGYQWAQLSVPCLAGELWCCGGIALVLVRRLL